MAETMGRVKAFQQERNAILESRTRIAEFEGAV
jgi:hypothetical protein